MKRNAMIVALKPLLFSIGVTFLGGILSGFLAGDSRQVYETLIQPPLAPPAVVFPIVWSILYLLMGISLYLIITSRGNRDEKRLAYALYFGQLLVNMAWSPVFFGLGLYDTAFWVAALLLLLLIATIRVFWRIRPKAAWLLVPVALWCAFALYLNYAIAALN